MITGTQIESLMNSSDVLRTLKISRSTLDRLVAHGRFPRPDVRTGRRLKWKPATVQSYIDGNFKAVEGRTR